MKITTIIANKAYFKPVSSTHLVNKQNPERYETLVNKAQENVKEKRSLLEHMAEFKTAE